MLDIGGAAFGFTFGGAQDTAPRKTIAIIGAGFSGTMTAIHLSRMLPASVKILLIERSGTYARGTAYADTGASHLLNVRAANMSAFPDDPRHFERWLNGCGAESHDDMQETAAGIFATRRLYGLYLQDTLAINLRHFQSNLQFMTADIEGMRRTGTGWELKARDGNRFEVSGVVLACGNLPPGRACDGVVVHNPWAADAVHGLSGTDPVLIVGTGLTMVDLVLGLRGAGFEGPVIALSRRGLLPQTHAAYTQPWPTPCFSMAERASATALLQAVRAQLRLAAAQGIGWRAVIDSLRPVSTALWLGLPPAEQARFLRHLRPYWDIHRHRMAPIAGAAIATKRDRGELRVLRGRIRSITQSSPGRAEISIANTGTGSSQTLRVQRVIYATGGQSIRSGEGLLGGLLREELVRLDELQLGLKVDRSLSVLDADGAPMPGLWALGPLVRGTFWECTAVPDIRIQAQQLSTDIAAALSAVWNSHQAFTSSP